MARVGNDKLLTERRWPDRRRSGPIAIATTTLARPFAAGFSSEQRQNIHERSGLRTQRGREPEANTFNVGRRGAQFAMHRTRERHA